MDMEGLEKYPVEEIVIDDNGTEVEFEDASGNEGTIKPLNPSSIRVETKPTVIDFLRLLIEQNKLDLAPDIQRRGGIWTDRAQSRFIESMLIRIPLPAFYIINATNEKKHLVVDGLQRLTTLKRFMIDKTLRLRGLEFFKDFNGMSFDELPRPYQRRIIETQVTVHMIERGTPDEVKFNIFKRINTGGLPLSLQEIRHILNQGEATKMLIRLASSAAFKQAVDNSISNERMAAEECVLRYIAFTITSYTEYDKGFDIFLNNAMKTINEMSDHERRGLEEHFYRVMKVARNIFGNDAFRKRYREGAPRLPINKPLFESWSVNFKDSSCHYQITHIL